MKHDNINPFHGLCVGLSDIRIISGYCQKGSLQDILSSNEIDLDEIFRDSLVFDLLLGVKYIHHSSVRSHGKLKSSNCLVDSRWVLKIADLDPCCATRRLPDTADVEEKYRDMLWTAPELLRQNPPPPRGSRPGDIYSFSIILQEITSGTNAFFLNETAASAKDTVELVIDGVEPQHRPEVTSRDEISPDYKTLMISCWAENAESRLTIDEILKSMNKANRKRKNLADVILMKLEKYSTNLENVVAKRNQELLGKKVETERLLHQILPKTVASTLIAGGIVHPETFDDVTIFFSDVDNFTQLCERGTPMASVALLNDLYELMDNCVSKYSVYKVETIGDVYMVSCGLPMLNERHAAEVADMALGLLDLVKLYEVKNAPGDRLHLRVGIHSGSCCAGVVGLTMPRYCLFGDTVNTASRMCSNSEAFRIHISQATRDILENQFGIYNITIRGQVLVKGKGTMTTFWLVGKR